MWRESGASRSARPARDAGTRLTREESRLVTTSPWRDVYLRHPIPPATGVDPLDFAETSNSTDRLQTEAATRMKIAYAAVWDQVKPDLGQDSEVAVGSWLWPADFPFPEAEVAH